MCSSADFVSYGFTPHLKKARFKSKSYFLSWLFRKKLLEASLDFMKKIPKSY